MPIIINNLETQQDIDNYREWISKKPTSRLKSLKKMLETDKKYRPDRWKKVDLRIELIEDEITLRNESNTGLWIKIKIEKNNLIMPLHQAK